MGRNGLRDKKTMDSSDLCDLMLTFFPPLLLPKPDVRKVYIHTLDITPSAILSAKRK